MTKKEYIEKHGIISNSEFKKALEIANIYGIDIQDYQLPIYMKLSLAHIKLMIKARLEIKFNTKEKFKNNFYMMYVLPRNKGIEIVNYTGHTLNFNGRKFFSDYAFCITGKNKINIQNEELYFIDGSYPVFSCTSCLEQDIERVKKTNYYWLKEEPKVIKVLPYQKTI